MAGWLNKLLGREKTLVIGESVFEPDPFPQFTGRADAQCIAEAFATGRGGLDFSIESLSRLDSLIEERRAALIKDSAGLDHPDLVDFVLGAGSYLTETMLRANDKLTFATKADIAASDAGAMFDVVDIQTIAAVCRTGGGMSFPYAKVIKFIEIGPEDSTLAFATVMLEKAGAVR